MSHACSQLLVRSSAERQSFFSCRRSAGDGDAVHISVSGELDIATVAHVDGELRRAQESSDVVLDLRELEFIDSSGAHLILDADRRIRRAGARMLVVRTDGSTVDSLFALLGIDHMLQLADSMSAPPRDAVPTFSP